MRYIVIILFALGLGTANAQNRQKVIVVNGQQVTEEQLGSMSSDDISSIVVEKGADGIYSIQLTTRDSIANDSLVIDSLYNNVHYVMSKNVESKSTYSYVRSGQSTGIDFVFATKDENIQNLDETYSYFIDGKAAKKSDFDSLDKDKIEAIVIENNSHGEKSVRVSTVKK